MMIHESGLALCRLHHWTFDRGLVGIRPDAVVEVSALVAQGENQAEAVLALHKQALSMPLDLALASATVALEWHAQQVFRWT
jgi:putative restriction endonuclease